MRLEHRPHARGRQPSEVDAVGHLDVMGAHGRQVAAHFHLHGPRPAGGEVVEVELAELVVDDGARAGRGGGDVRPRVLQGLGHLLRRRVVDEQGGGAVAVGEEVDAVTDPHGIEVAGALPRDLLDGGVGEPGDPDRRGQAAAVALPGHVDARRAAAVPARHVGEMGTVGREGALLGRGQRQGLRQSAPLDGDGVEPVRERAVAARAEDHPLAVRRPAHRAVDAGVPGQAAGDAAGDRHEIDVPVAVVLAGEGEPLAVGREGGVGLDADSGGQPAGLSPLAPHHPEVPRVSEGDLRPAEDRSPQQRLSPRRHGCEEGEKQDGESKAAHKGEPPKGRRSNPVIRWVGGKVAIV